MDAVKITHPVDREVAIQETIPETYREMVTPPVATPKEIA